MSSNPFTSFIERVYTNSPEVLKGKVRAMTFAVIAIPVLSLLTISMEVTAGNRDPVYLLVGFIALPSVGLISYLLLRSGMFFTGAEFAFVGLLFTVPVTMLHTAGDLARLLSPLYFFPFLPISGLPQVNRRWIFWFNNLLVILTMVVYIQLTSDVILKVGPVEKAYRSMVGGYIVALVFFYSYELMNRNTVAFAVSRNEESLKLLENQRQVHQVATDTLAAFTGTAQEVRKASERLSEMATEQAAAIEQMSASVEQIAASVAQNLENARRTNHQTSDTADTAARSREALQSNLQKLREVAEKVRLVKEIASQTNLLALNATIEAARASEQGRGFAVVATEVGKLADSSSQAAREIISQVQDTVAGAENVGQSIGQAVTSMLQSSQMVHEITDASEQQGSGIAQIERTIQELNRSAQENASTAEELASSMDSFVAKLDDFRNFLSSSDSENSVPLRLG